MTNNPPRMREPRVDITEGMERAMSGDPAFIPPRERLGRGLASLLDRGNTVNPPPAFLDANGRPMPEGGAAAMPQVPRPQIKERTPSEAEAVGTLATKAMTYHEVMKSEIERMMAEAKREYEALERHGLSIIELGQKECAEFVARAEQYIGNTSKIHHGMRDVYASVAAPEGGQE